MPLDQKPAQRVRAAENLTHGHEHACRHARAVEGPSVCMLQGVRVLTSRKDHNPIVARGGALLSCSFNFEQMQSDQVPYCNTWVDF